MLTQTFVYFKKFFRIQTLDLIKSLFICSVISTVVVLIIYKDMFTTYEKTKTGFFTLVSACIWIGLFNSIQLICREKNTIVKDELDKKIHASSYVAAHFIYQIFVCLLQSIIVISLNWFFIDFPTDGILFKVSIIEYFITVFLILYSSDAFALVISSFSPTSVFAMTVMPFVLIVQLVFSGVLFELNEISSKFANFIISKWGMDAMGSIGNLNSSSLPLGIAKEYPNLNFPEREVEDIYLNTVSHIEKVWLIILLFIVVSYVISVFGLKFTTKYLKRND